MKESRKIEALRQLQFLLDHKVHILPREIGLTDAEVETMVEEYLVEAGDQRQEPEGERFAILSILPAGYSLLMKTNLHLPRVALISLPASALKRIGSGFWKILLVIVAAAVPLILTWLLKRYWGQ